MGEYGESRGLLDPVIARVFLGKTDTVLAKSPEYQATLPEMENLYKQVWRWHGTGRYHHHEDQVTDVLKEIIDKDGLVPHRDPLDYTRGVVYTVSASPSRTYSSLYAQLHYEKGQRLRNPFQTTAGWFYYVSNIVWSAANNDRRLFSKEFRNKNNLNHEGRAFFRDKYTKAPVGLSDYLRGGVSDIPGNYPVLIGIKEGAFCEANIADVYSNHESRSEMPIQMASFTHLEVPEKNVKQSIYLLHQRGIHTPVLPIEWGEEFSKSLPVSFLRDGQPLKDQM